jgi:hypothetical protein
MSDKLINFPNLASVDNQFRKYRYNVSISELYLDEVWIDIHYEKNHSESMNDELIFDLVDILDQFEYKQVDEKDGFDWYTSEVKLDEKPYKVVWLIPPDINYLGIRNAYRRSK